jgi:hypothetical protein
MPTQVALILTHKKENFLLRRTLMANKTFSAGQNLALELK